MGERATWAGVRSRRLFAPLLDGPHLVAIVLAALVVILAVVSGTVVSSDVTLVVMGFDPDRAQLITALIVGGVAAAAAGLIVPQVRFAAVLGALGIGALYLETFLTETQNALNSHGAFGYFSLHGWALTVVTLVTIAVLAGAAGAAMAVVARPALVAVGRDLGGLPGSKSRAPLLRRPAVAAIVLALLVVTTPAFGDMVNLSPDALMLSGVDRVGLTGPNTPANQAAQPTAEPSANATDLPASSGSPEPLPSLAAIGPRPWLAWKPTGAGNMVNVHLPPPWTGGTRNVADVSIYTPPGYDPHGSRAYPVLYEAPTGGDLWNRATGSTGALDSLIDTGQIPAMIVVFIDEWGGPYPDSECANSTDGKERMETFIAHTVVDYIDSNYRTIKSAAARGIMGMSQGGYCAAMLLSRNPTVFSTSISFSGYFHAGTPNAASMRPFGTAQAVAAYSPDLAVLGIPTAERSSLEFILIANPAQDYYGYYQQSFGHLLRNHGFLVTMIDSKYPHGWQQVRYEFPGAVQDWSARLVANKVF